MMRMISTPLFIPSVLSLPECLAARVWPLHSNSLLETLSGHFGGEETSSSCSSKEKEEKQIKRTHQEKETGIPLLEENRLCSRNRSACTDVLQRVGRLADFPADQFQEYGQYKTYVEIFANIKTTTWHPNGQSQLFCIYMKKYCFLPVIKFLSSIF